jgi:ceramide glucosyltransferase
MPASHLVALGLAAAAALGLTLAFAQLAALARHLRGPRPEPRVRPPISILKPLCGLDDRLAGNLLSFGDLPYPDYEVLLGVRSTSDHAYPIACAAARLRPDRFRVVVQEGEPGLNPKVNQLMTLVRHARHPLFVISDSNTRVEAGYLDEIAAALEGDPSVGLVTHPLVGDGDDLPGARWGAACDNLHLTGTITPGLAAAKTFCGKDYVVGKSMAMRRADLEALGGFESVKDVLAEDFVLGRAVVDELGKRIVLGRTPVTCLSVRRTVGAFIHRYARWSVMQHQCAGWAAYLGLLLLNPVLLASLALVFAPTPAAGLVLAVCVAGRMTIDTLAGRFMRGRAFRLRVLIASPLKDLLAAAAWSYGLVKRSIEWRGSRLMVLRGSRLRVRRPPRAQTPRRSDTGPASAAA